MAERQEGLKVTVDLERLFKQWVYLCLFSTCTTHARKGTCLTFSWEKGDHTGAITKGKGKD